ncbi:transposase [Streptomyces sp. NBC_01613]|uniref:zinc ribbon domain-containing protein n=1 Tax=Streptomyces sp. NBC_01613 TaxID=2975896 RepID=UPI003864D3D5
MAELKAAPQGGHARYTYRLRVSSVTAAVLEAEWVRCRWVWNECVARSVKAHRDGETCGPARLDRMLTEARANNAWLRMRCSVPQQQIIRDFGKSLTKAVKDIVQGLPGHRRAGMPKHARDVRLVHPAHTTMDCAQCGARTKHALPLSERTYTCTACGAMSPRDKNSARVMLVRAGLDPAGADRVRLDRSLSDRAA